MIHDTPMRAQHDRYAAALFDEMRQRAGDAAGARPGAASGSIEGEPELLYLPYGPMDDGGSPTAAMIGTFGSVELAYATLRRGCGILDQMATGTLVVTGEERIEFLNRMLTQELADLESGGVRASFWLNRKGRIESDMLLAELGDRLIISLDIHQAVPAASSLESYVFTEDVEIREASGEFHHLGVHGPTAAELLRHHAAAPDDVPSESGSAATLTLAGVEVVAIRHDLIGAPGFDLVVPFEAASSVWEALMQSRDEHRVRPCGWFAWNIARIESALPVYNIDFGSTTLPHESGLLDARVSFTKGCYLGQEIVARMHALGQPKQVIVGLRMKEDALPVEGANVFEPPASDEAGQFGATIGAVSSSTISPMLGAQPIALATIRTAKAVSGSTVVVEAEGGFTTAEVVELEALRQAAAPPTGAST